ncbi:MAG: cohesin domain-containing protein, partial [Firmicutes bacterium]|nr:cohesin domain-containing protein [Bacillota bacterium]
MKKLLWALMFSAIILLAFSLAASADDADGNIARLFVVDDTHHGEYCTEDADTVREFGLGTKYGPIITNGVVDPLFAKGGYLFGPTDKGTLKIYAIAVDFTDAVGDMQIPYGRHRNVVKSAYNGTIFDFSDPQIHFQTQFKGTTALKANPKFTWLGTNAQEFKGIAQILEEQSMGKMKVDVELLNERLAKAQGIDTTVERVPWFHINGPIFAYSDAGPADCEDYRQFARLYQAAIFAAVEQLEAAGLNNSVLGQGSNIEDIGFIYIITPFNAFGYRLGFQGGGGIMSSYSFNEQALAQRDSEYRHVPGVLTPGGRMVGSGVFGMKGIVNPGNSNSISPNIGNALHELTHGLGMFDDYSYGGIANNTGEAAASGMGNWGVMGSNMSSVSPDPPIWRKFRQGWLKDDEIKVIMPGDNVDINIRAAGSAPGIDGGVYTNDPSVLTRMVVIPKEWRTRDTFGIVWDNGWNPYKNDYNWYDWFTNIYVGGETNAIKSFPTFYTLESRKALGADGNPLGRYTGIPATRQGVVVSYMANPTWETGHGAGGMKVVTGDNGLRVGGVSSWTDPHIGLTVTVLESNVFYDKVNVNYTGKAANAAKHVYQGLLTVSESYTTVGQNFTVDFNIMTLGSPAPNDATAVSSTIQRVATPLAVPGGLAGYTMTVAYDPVKFDLVDSGNKIFENSKLTNDPDRGIIEIETSGGPMIDKDTILNLIFKVKDGAALGDSVIDATITDVTLINWRGETIKKGDPGFDDVGAFGNGTLAALYNTTANNSYTPGIKSTGGKVVVGNSATYTIKGSIVCDTPGPAPGSFIGVESAVTLYNNSNTAIATAKSDWNGNYLIKGVPAGAGYYIKAEKSKYASGLTAAFAVAADTAVAELQLARQTYPVSGTVYGAKKSDGSDKTPLADVDVYVLSIGNGYKVLGGPAKTDSQGHYTVYATTDSADKAFAGLAVKVEGNAAKYGAQLTLFEKDDLYGKQVGDLDLNMGTQTHLILDDFVYPANTARLGAEGTFAFSLGGKDSQVVTGRDITLTETQDIHIRTVTKSNTIYYQLRNWADGSAVGARVRSVGTTNGDDMIRDVPKGQYYLELTRDGYVSLNSMPFTVDTTRVLLRDGQSTNTMDMNTRIGANVVSGTVVDARTGEPLEGVKVEFISWSNTGGWGNPVYSGADGTFSYDVLADDKDIIFSKDYYKTKNINIVSGGASGLLIELTPAYDYRAYLNPQTNGLAVGETFYVDVMLSGYINYTQLSTEIAYDPSLLKYEGYADLKGLVAAVSPLNGNKISIRSIPSLNMIYGEPCSPDVKIVTLKFTALSDFSEDKTTSSLSFASLLINPPAGFIGASTAPGATLPLTIYENDFVKSFYNNLALYPEWVGVDDQGLPTTMPIFQ